MNVCFNLFCLHSCDPWDYWVSAAKIENTTRGRRGSNQRVKSSFKENLKHRKHLQHTTKVMNTLFSTVKSINEVVKNSCSFDLPDETTTIGLRKKWLLRDFRDDHLVFELAGGFGPFQTWIAYLWLRHRGSSSPPWPSWDTWAPCTCTQGWRAQTWRTHTSTGGIWGAIHVSEKMPYWAVQRPRLWTKCHQCVCACVCMCVCAREWKTQMKSFWAESVWLSPLLFNSSVLASCPLMRRWIGSSSAVSRAIAFSVCVCLQIIYSHTCAYVTILQNAASQGNSVVSYSV